MGIILSLRLNVIFLKLLWDDGTDNVFTKIFNYPFSTLTSNRAFALLLHVNSSQICDRKVPNMSGFLGRAIGLWIFPFAQVLGKKNKQQNNNNKTKRIWQLVEIIYLRQSSYPSILSESVFSLTFEDRFNVLIGPTRTFFSFIVRGIKTLAPDCLQQNS